MELRADFTKLEIVRPDDHVWVPSPSGGVERMMLDRIGEEVARATTIVRFAPGSAFAAHTHGGGEEYLVLDGVFSDETGDFPKGSYVRNPIGTTHQPHTALGCVIFVKLHQFAVEDRAEVSVDTTAGAFAPGVVAGVSELPLHTFGGEVVKMVRLGPGVSLPAMRGPGLSELLVVSGTITADDAEIGPNGWARWPRDLAVDIRSRDGALIWTKSGHVP